MATRRLEVPWPGEPQWTPCPHAPPTYLYISLPLVSNCSPFISPPFYTYVHSQPMFFYPKNPPNCIPILPCPLPYHFAFLDHLWSSPCYQHPPLPLHLFTLFIRAFYPLPDPSHPPAPACSPTPIFAFIPIYGHFLLHVYILPCSHMCTHDF